MRWPVEEGEFRSKFFVFIWREASRSQIIRSAVAGPKKKGIVRKFASV